ncbi:hypothetical protein DH2020_037791 [Rehmannia glutinosa]|uniref:Scarecrow-like protein n=1 Tax=Rehmannia glutinosa TaxID=99300 RepID=A0ABR0V140_REHGL
MKVPFPANNNPAINCTVNYEPKSVLDLRRSPSPVSNNILAVDPLQLEEDHHALINPQLDDWDSLMRDLGLHDDSIKPFSDNNNQSDQIQISQEDNHHLPDFPIVSSFDLGILSEIPIYTTASLNINPNSINSINSFEGLVSGDLSSGNWNVGFDYVDELIRLAECFETNSIQLGQVILARLNQRLRSPAGKPLQRAAFYFKEALQSLLTGSTRPSHRAANSFEIVQAIKAERTFSSISPIPMFAGFTANQAVLEGLDGSVHVHVIDFDIGLGGHWASFMKELADEAGSRKAAPPALRISALVSEEYAAESRLIRENLALFARDLNIRFEIDFVLIRTFEYLSFKAFKFMDGEKIAVILSPAIFRHIGTGFLSDLRRVSPHVVVHVDAEGQMGFGTASYRQAVIDGLEFYSTVLESLEAANFNGAGAGGGDWMKRIETFVLYPRIKRKGS